MADPNSLSSTLSYYNFKKPNNKLPTCYLYIPVFKILKNNQSILQIFQLYFQNFGVVKHIEIKPAFSYLCAYIVYNYVQDAISAYPLSCRFATIEENKEIDFQIVCDISNRNSNNAIPGLILIDNFISEEEELELLSFCGNNTWKSDFSRRVQHFGYEFDYNTRNINPLENLGLLPNTLKKFADRISEICHTTPLNQVTVNEYEPGQGIRRHTDTHSAFEESICSLSILSPIVIQFQDPVGKKINIFLPSRSLFVMKDEARYMYTHFIHLRSFDLIVNGKHDSNIMKLERRKRISLTFRTIRGRTCDCNYKDQCDRT